MKMAAKLREYDVHFYVRVSVLAPNDGEPTEIAMRWERTQRWNEEGELVEVWRDDGTDEGDHSEEPEITSVPREEDYLSGTAVEYVSDLNAMAALPKMGEDEWEERFDWLDDECGDKSLLEDTAENRKMLAERDPRLVWSQIDDPTGEDDAWIVPGYWSRGANGWYLCGKPWDPTNQCVAVLAKDRD